MITTILTCALLAARDGTSVTVDLKLDEERKVEVGAGRSVTLKLTGLEHHRDSLCGAVRGADVTVEVDGKPVTLGTGNYRLPVTFGGIRIDCPITNGYLEKGNRGNIWALDGDARIRVWPGDAPLLPPGTFMYPARQRWFTTGTQMANEPTWVDGGESPKRTKVYYHYGLDIGGTEGLVDIVAATDGLVVSSGNDRLEGHENTPVSPRYDVIYIQDTRGWYYRYSHLKVIEAGIRPGVRVKMGRKLGLLGKEGGSGGWTHVHFDINRRQPNGKYGIEEGYGYLWEAYLREYKPDVLAVARPHHVGWTGETFTLDGSRSWAREGIARYDWTFTDGAKAEGSKVERTYAKPGRYSEILKVTDAKGRVGYDFAYVEIHDKARPDQPPPSLHLTYGPTFGLRPGSPVTFQVRAFRTTDGEEAIDFGDGSKPVTVKSDGNVDAHAPRGYAEAAHRYKREGDYIVTARRTNRHGMTAVAHVHVHVGE